MLILGPYLLGIVLAQEQLHRRTIGDTIITGGGYRIYLLLLLHTYLYMSRDHDIHVRVTFLYKQI